ncbi:hypothetical protein VP01_4001g1 [Puccinia sorghi]|uniref:Uncharacterized protein n=1 Tax=Puccinia sorghi TaxID=27349 RepID=A0A0L6URX9_9BASI|nr:hypothetical protein VP01_4001g1 [Puccinia sorghi]
MALMDHTWGPRGGLTIFKESLFPLFIWDHSSSVIIKHRDFSVLLSSYNKNSTLNNSIIRKLVAGYLVCFDESLIDISLCLLILKLPFFFEVHQSQSIIPITIPSIDLLESCKQKLPTTSSEQSFTPEKSKTKFLTGSTCITNVHIFSLSLMIDAIYHLLTKKQFFFFEKQYNLIENHSVLVWHSGLVAANPGLIWACPSFKVCQVKLGSVLRTLGTVSSSLWIWPSTLWEIGVFEIFGVRVLPWSLKSPETPGYTGADLQTGDSWGWKGVDHTTKNLNCLDQQTPNQPNSGILPIFSSKNILVALEGWVEGVGRIYGIAVVEIIQIKYLPHTLCITYFLIACGGARCQISWNWGFRSEWRMSLLWSRFRM